MKNKIIIAIIVLVIIIALTNYYADGMISIKSVDWNNKKVTAKSGYKWNHFTAIYGADGYTSVSNSQKKYDVFLTNGENSMTLDLVVDGKVLQSKKVDFITRQIS